MIKLLLKQLISTRQMFKIYNKKNKYIIRSRLISKTTSGQAVLMELNMYPEIMKLTTILIIIMALSTSSSTIAKTSISKRVTLWMKAWLPDFKNN